jgi:hypothetical protein
VTPETEPFEGYAVVELMGHRVVRGYVREVTHFGVALIEVTIPAHTLRGTEEPERKQLYSPSSLYCLEPTTEEAVREFYTPRPTLALPRRPLIEEMDGDSSGYGVEDEDDEGDDEEGDEERGRITGEEHEENLAREEAGW